MKMLKKGWTASQKKQMNVGTRERQKIKRAIYKWYKWWWYDKWDSKGIDSNSQEKWNHQQTRISINQKCGGTSGLESMNWGNEREERFLCYKNKQYFIQDKGR